MSRLIRTPKSASDWTDNELGAYRVVVEERTAASFFCTGELPEPNCPQDFLRNRTATVNVDLVTDRLLWNLEETIEQPRLREASVDLFAYALLDATGFTSRRIHPFIRRPLPLLIGGEQRSAQTDVCLLHDHTVLLLVQEDKSDAGPAGYAEAQLVAEAVAARQHNVSNGTISSDATQTVPAILMIGTYPVFYKIPVSAELSLSIASLGYPATETVVTKCSPSVPRPSRRHRDGMDPLDSRTSILQHLEAFRRHVFIPCSEATLGAPLGLSL